MSPLEITLVILLVTIIAFVSGKVPFSVISTGIILALILTGIKTPAEAFGGFINTNVIMFVAMFVIGAGLTKTPLIDKAQSLVIRYKDNMRMLIFLSCVAGAFLGAITSATATAAIMIPLLVGIANDIGVSRSKLLYPSMACANIATQMTFLGQGASNMAWNDVMMQAGAPTPLHIWDFTIARIPMLTIAILYMTFVGYKLMPDIPNEQFSDAAHTASESEKLSPFKRKLAVLIVLVSIAMMLLENVIGVKMYLTSCIGAAALVLTGVLTEREALNSIHQPTIFLFAGVLALSDAIQTTGAGDVVADWMIRLLGDTTNPYIIMLVFFLVPFILTQVMSNLATLTIFIPLVTSACIRMGVDPRAAVVGVITASCVSIMTPMAAPTSCIGAAALVLTGVLTEREALNSIHQPTIFLFAGVLALSDAIQTTGAGDVVADWMIRLLGDTTNPYIIMLVFFLVPFILTQVMSNLATLTIFIPLVTSACIRMGVDPRAAVVGVITASCVSIMTPMAAPCQIMIIEPGGYTLKDYLKCGTPLALILIVVSVFFLPTLYPFA